MKKDFYVVVFVLFVAMTSCNEQKAETSKVLADKEIKVKVSEVKLQKLESTLRYSGTVEPEQSIPLTFQTMGNIEKVLVEAGDHVSQGQLLATIEQKESKNLYDISKAKYDQAQDAYNRLKTVYEQGSLPEIKWVEMETNLQQAESSFELSKNNLEKCQMYAPVSGIVGRRNIEPGMSAISLTSAPLEIVKIDNVVVKISVSENEISKIKKGQKANFLVSALGDKTYEGEITGINSVADAISRTYEVKIMVKNNGYELKPGMVCDVTLNLQTEKDLIVVPNQSVTKDNNGDNYVFVVDTNSKRAKKQKVQIGMYHNENIVIISGLNIGQIIVVEGKEKLSDNSLIVM